MALGAHLLRGPVILDLGTPPVPGRAAESESIQELESVGVSAGVDKIWLAQTLAESQTNTRLQNMVLADRLCTLPKTLKDRENRRVAMCR